MSRKTMILAVLSLLSFSATFANSRTTLAQRVWVGDGGVRVRAPFVRVDVYPGGGVSVRAPFAAIDTPGRYYYYEREPVVIERRIVQPSFPTAAELAAMDVAQLDQALRAISDSLQQRLDRFNTAATWQRYLRLPQQATDQPIDPLQRRQTLANILDRFDSVASDAQYEMISRLPAFAAMQLALTEAVSRPDRPESTVEPDSEELPLPLPERPAPQDREQPFFTPRQR